MLDQFSVSTESTIPSAERGGVLDILPRLFEDRPEHPGLLAQFTMLQGLHFVRRSGSPIVHQFEPR